MEDIWMLAEIMAVIAGTFAVGMWIGHRVGVRNGEIRAYLNMAGTDQKRTGCGTLPRLAQ
jgi:hypothetical protein